VCSCNRRTRGELLRAIRANGLGTVPEVARATAATTGCGSCAGDVEELLAGFAGGTNGAPGARKLEPDHVE
jgi:nitrite reductase (NADH) large subunit